MVKNLETSINSIDLIKLFYFQSALAQSVRAREHTVSLQRQKTPLMSVTVITLKKSNCEAPVIVELWGMQSTPLLQLHPGSLSEIDSTW